MNIIVRWKEIWERDREYAARYLMVAAGSISVHGLLALLFALEGYTGLALLNAASVVLFLGWSVLFTRKPVDDFMLLLLYGDVVLHACVCNLTFGSDPGFYLYPLFIIPVTFFLSSRDLHHPHKVVVGVSIGLGILSLGLMLATLSVAPSNPIADPRVVRRFVRINLLVGTALLSVYSFEFIIQTMSAQSSLSFHAENDPLTGLRNRYGFSREAERIQGTQYCVIMCDIDDFKQVNDLYGHTVGDMLLSRIGEAMRGSVRREDILCRWGGEEFLLVIRSGMDDACAVVERIRKKVDGICVRAKDAAITVTMTFGVADCREASDFDELVKLADSNLLRGKRSGKNCVVLSSDDREQLRAEPNLETEMDTSFLTSRIFSAFSATSDTTYIYMCNLETNVSRWSRTAVDYFGLPGEYMYDAGSIWMGFIHPEDREMYSQDVNDVLSGRKRFHDVSYRARNRDGEYVRVVCKGVVTEGDAKNPAVFAGTITNLGLAEPETASHK